MGAQPFAVTSQRFQLPVKAAWGWGAAGGDGWGARSIAPWSDKPQCRAVLFPPLFHFH